MDCRAPNFAVARRTLSVVIGDRVRAALIVAISLLCCVSLSSVAMAQTPTSQQLDIYKNLSPDQQKALLDSMGRNKSGVTADQPLEFPNTIRPRDTQDTKSAQELDPKLKAGDTLLLYLEIRKFEGPEPKVRMPINAGATNTNGLASAPPTETRTAVTFTAERTKDLQDISARVQRRNPYRLDDAGSLQLPETGAMALAGLTVEQAQERMAADYLLKDFKITITRLPVEPQGVAALKPFGYDLFAGSPSTFAPATDVPVPAEYVVGPGDSIHVQLIGNTKGNYSLTVDREGKINFPELGPISVGGQKFESMRAAVERRVKEQMIGTQASVTMGELRSIRIFILGDAEQPGSYTVSGLSTMTNALFVSGGVKPIGSLRKIELKRNGVTITHLDLYDLLLKGDTRGDARLLPDDVIFIPPIGATVGLSGQVRRPAIYELNGESTAKELLALAGGLTATADPTTATLERIDQNRQHTTLDVNLSSAQVTKMQSGDVLRVPAIRPALEDSVTLSGYVYRPGNFQYRSGMRLSDLLPSIDELKPNADQHYVMVRRELPPNRRVEVFSADLAQAIAMRGSKADIELQPRDRVYVFDLESGRDSVMSSLIRELREQATFDAPTSEVLVGGQVRVPGTYPLEPGMRVSDLIRAGGSLNESAFDGTAELTRYTISKEGARQTDLLEIDLKKVRAGDLAANIELKPFDNLVIKEAPLWHQQETVELKGEVRFPGKYPIYRGETLRSVLERAGGLTSLAFANGAVFTRTELREREAKQMETLATRMQSDLTQLSLQAAQETGKDANQSLAAGQALLANLRATKPVGRLVINLPKSEHAATGSTNDIMLRDGDLLVVPRKVQEVTVLGEVQSGTSHLYQPDLSRDDYINLSGGLTQRADKKRTYVVKADGSVITKNGSAWFSSSTSISPGDTIVVPLNAEKMRALPMWQAVTTIIYNIAIAAAAVHSF